MKYIRENEYIYLLNIFIIVYTYKYFTNIVNITFSQKVHDPLCIKMSNLAHLKIQME